MARLNNYSASGVISDAKRPIRYHYDADGDLIPICERPGFAAKVAMMQSILTQADKAARLAKDDSLAWVTGCELRTQLGCTPDEWCEILASLIDEVAVKCELRPQYRLEARRRMRTYDRSSNNSYSTHRQQQPDKLHPTAAYDVK